MLSWFKSGDNIESNSLSSDKQLTTYKKYQWQVIISLILGYSFFYTTRLSLSVAKKPLIDSGIMTQTELGIMGSALFFVYAFGKFFNGFLADHANIRKFMSFGLLCSALINIFLGLSNNALLFIVLWGFNGWFQSMGSAPSCVSIFQWFQPSKRGTVYSIWAGAHNIGEGITFVLTSLVVSYFGWRAGFIAPGLLSVIVVFIMWLYLKDRPQAMGLPEPHIMFNEGNVLKKTKKLELKDQLFILRSKTVWIIALACAGMYISRYAINSWAILFLQESKGYTLLEAGMAMSTYPIAGLVGAVAAGFLSDRFFGSHRPLTATIYGLCNLIGMGILFWAPNSHTSDAIALTIFGFGIGGLIVFLAGLMAAEFMPKTVVGSVKGFIGLFAYTGASVQEYVSSKLISSEMVNGALVYDFQSATIFWFASGVVSMLFVFLVWNQKPVDLKE